MSWTDTDTERAQWAARLLRGLPASDANEDAALWLDALPDRMTEQAKPKASKKADEKPPPSP